MPEQENEKVWRRWEEEGESEECCKRQVEKASDRHGLPP